MRVEVPNPDEELKELEELKRLNEEEYWRKELIALLFLAYIKNVYTKQGHKYIH